MSQPVRRRPEVNRELAGHGHGGFLSRRAASYSALSEKLRMGLIKPIASALGSTAEVLSGKSYMATPTSPETGALLNRRARSRGLLCTSPAPGDHGRRTQRQTGERL
jgi:hypothetical protein